MCLAACHDVLQWQQDPYVPPPRFHHHLPIHIRLPTDVDVVGHIISSHQAGGDTIELIYAFISRTRTIIAPNLLFTAPWVAFMVPVWLSVDVHTNMEILVPSLINGLPVTVWLVVSSTLHLLTYVCTVYALLFELHTDQFLVLCCEPCHTFGIDGHMRHWQIDC